MRAVKFVGGQVAGRLAGSRVGLQPALGQDAVPQIEILLTERPFASLRVLDHGCL